MKKNFFYIILFFNLLYSVIGIFLIFTRKTFSLFNNDKIIVFSITIGLLQLLYIYGKSNKSKVYAHVQQPHEQQEKEKTKLKSAVTLKDIAGLEEVKEEFMEIIDFIRYAQDYKKMGAHIPKGFLLHGPPGTGKTLLASALASEIDASFLLSSGSEFMEKYVGVGARRIRDLFQKAKESSPSIIFIDEIDAIGSKRVEEGQAECNQTLNQLLTEMDGFKSEDDHIIVVVGATNRIDILDPALLRPGRFDKHIYIGNPNKIAREQILKIHTRNKPVSEEINLSSIASKTHGLSGAHIANIVNEAAILAVKHKRSTILQEDFHNAIEKVVAGLKIQNPTVNIKEKRIVSFHEAGHALVGSIYKLYNIEKISIVPTHQSLGYVLSTSFEDQFLYSKEDLIKKIKILLAGRAAEEIIFHQITTGAKDDLNKATDLVLSMVCEYGMSELGNRTFNEKMIYGNMKEINKEIQKIIHQAYESTLNILSENKDCLTCIAQKLFEQEVLSGEDLKNIIKQNISLKDIHIPIS
ncbi:ATP-dependent metallopeptidase FtsH/Yme1/Tma family protein [Anaerophilus nitritogenes]|uniref:ATP-dependent metallopeptidase FtsH/Yme1/Tma family protein n=1 Tax=Anaerophilus nitritogenes TaxID=2498136 RepID=UPI00101E0E8C|nr:AAA family ATPase [Anaerophilus nitritogenes]